MIYLWEIKDFCKHCCCCVAQSCSTLCDPRDGSPPGSTILGILQARTLEWVAISFSNAWKWKVKGKSLSRVRPLVTPWTAAHQAPPSMGFSRQEYWSGVPLPSPLLLGGIYSSLETLQKWGLIGSPPPYAVRPLSLLQVTLHSQPILLNEWQLIHSWLLLPGGSSGNCYHRRLHITPSPPLSNLGMVVGMHYFNSCNFGELSHIINCEGCTLLHYSIEAFSMVH